MDYKRTEQLRSIWDVTTNIIGYSLIAASIIVGVNLDYVGRTAFTVFCIAAAVYFFSKYIFKPKSRHWTFRIKNYCKRAAFESAFGAGEVLYGNFGDLLGRRGHISYCFLSICYIPLIPVGCYSFAGKGRKMIQITGDKITGEGAYNLNTLRWDWKEILYIYMKNWSFAVMVITVINTIMWDYVNPAIYE